MKMYNGVILLKFTKIVSILLRLNFSLLCMHIREDDLLIKYYVLFVVELVLLVVFEIVQVIISSPEGGRRERGGCAITNSCLRLLMN